MDVDADRARYEADRAKDLALGGADGIDAVMKAASLDALLFPGARAARRSRREPGYPTVIVPFGLVAERADAAVPGGLRRRSRRRSA